MVNKKKSNFFIFIVISLLTQLIFLYYVKYSNQGLALSEFTIAHIGNIFNLLITLSIIIGIYILLSKKNQSVGKSILTTFIILQFTLLIISFIGTIITLPLSDSYILNQPGDKFIIALLFLAYQYLTFVFISIIWVNVWRTTEMSLIKSAFNGVVMLLLFLLITFLFISTKGYGSGKWALAKSKNNIGIVLGAAVWSGNQPSPTLAGRVDRALELIDDGYIDKILLTGSNAPGEYSEASVALDYAIVRGIDSTKVILEESTTSTTEQVKFIKNNMSNEGFKSIIVVSDLYHLPRVLEISEFYNLNIKVASSKRQLNFESKFYNKIRESIALLIFWCFAL
jgi:vancomycin permeability regulator SanA